MYLFKVRDIEVGVTTETFNSQYLPLELRDTGGVKFNVQNKVASLSDNIP